MNVYNAAVARGLTLIELVIVVTIMAAVSGTALMAFGSIERDHASQMRHNELRLLARAVTAYYQDTLDSFHSEEELSQLLVQPNRSDQWSQHRRRGSRGPYIDWHGRNHMMVSKSERVPEDRSGMAYRRFLTDPVTRELMHSDPDTIIGQGRSYYRYIHEYQGTHGAEAYPPGMSAHPDDPTRLVVNELNRHFILFKGPSPADATEKVWYVTIRYQGQDEKIEPLPTRMPAPQGP